MHAVTSTPSWTSWAESELAALQARHRLRTLATVDTALVSFASNDYLGLASHPRVRAAAQSAIDRFGTGATASRLVSGTRSVHAELESALARWKSTEAALVFSTGYAANMGVLSVLGGLDVTIFSDELNHASIIDGCRLSRSRIVVYRHLDLEHLATLLAQTRGRKIVVTESVFSMDGDRANENALADLCSRHDALLILDQAHCVLDDSHASDTRASVLYVGTLSKALAAQGGFVAGPRALIDLLINRARTFIFTTGLCPASTAAALAALEISQSGEGSQLRGRLRAHIDALRPGHPSPILPIIAGTDEAAVDLAAQLRKAGIFAPAIRPPTVPPGTARIRIALSAAHTSEMVELLRHAVLRAGRRI
jgi:8-amino-7-oxononanoate synthase